MVFSAMVEILFGLFCNSSRLAYGAELPSAIHALEVTSRKDWNYLWMECDSTYVVDLLAVGSNKVLWEF